MDTSGQAAQRQRPLQRAVLACALALTAAVPPALAADAAPVRQTVSIASCAGGPPLAFSLSDSRVLLEADDQDLVHAAMLERFPVLQRDGFAPQRIMLWHKNEQWLFVSLTASAQTPAAPCFTATFLAEGFDFTRELIQKYFFAGSAPA